MNERKLIKQQLTKVIKEIHNGATVLPIPAPPPKNIPSIVHVSPDSFELDFNSMQVSLCRKLSIISGGMELISSLSQSNSHRSEQRQKSSQITATNF